MHTMMLACFSSSAGISISMSFKGCGIYPRRVTCPARIRRAVRRAEPSILIAPARMRSRPLLAQEFIVKLGEALGHLRGAEMIPHTGIRGRSHAQRASPDWQSRKRSREAKASASRGGTSQPVFPSSINSGTPPTEVATTGRPAAMASRAAIGKPSSRDGITKTSQRRQHGSEVVNPPKKLNLPPESGVRDRLFQFLALRPRAGNLHSESREFTPERGRRTEQVLDPFQLHQSPRSPEDDLRCGAVAQGRRVAGGTVTPA